MGIGIETWCLIVQWLKGGGECGEEGSDIEMRASAADFLAIEGDKNLAPAHSRLTPGLPLLLFLLVLTKDYDCYLYSLRSFLTILSVSCDYRPIGYPTGRASGESYYQQLKTGSTLRGG